MRLLNIMKAPAMTEAEVIERAKEMWRKDCARYVATHGDKGGCVVFAGIVRIETPEEMEARRERAYREDRASGISHHKARQSWNLYGRYTSPRVISPWEVTNQQGECVFSHGARKVVKYLNRHGVPCRYESGMVD